MAIEIINVGASPNDGNGDPIRDAFIKCNDNFDELDTTKIGGSGTDNYVAKFSGTDSIENSLIFDDGSFVGVNTTTPTTNLEVSGPDYSFSAGRQASNRKVSIGLNDNGQPSIQSFDSSNAPVNLTINPSGGNVGMGTTSPLGILHLYKSGVTTRMVIDGDAGQSKIITYRTGGLQRFGMYVNNTLETGSNAGSDFQIRTYNDAGSLLSTPFFIKRSTGNVGIGTTSPQAKLHSNSDILTGYFQNGTDIIYDALKLTNNTGSNNLSGNGARIQFYNNTNNSTNLLGASIRSVNVDYGWASDLILSSVQNNGYSSQTVNDAIYIKSSGNVGIGTTDTFGFKTLINSGNSSNNLILFSTTSGVNLTFNDLNTGVGSQIVGVANDLYISTNNTERMRITSSGNVGIGTTSPIRPLDVFADSGANAINIRTRSLNDYGVLSFSNSTASEIISNIYIHRTGTNIGALIFETNNGSSASERMRINANGNVLIKTSTEFAQNCTTHIATGKNGGIVIRDVAANGVLQLFQHTPGTNVGSITQNGVTTSYNVTSDYRLKQDFKKFNGLDLISKIKVYDYQWKSNKSRMNGVIAHELQEVVPYAVTGEKDEENMQQVDYSKLVPILVQAIQELKEEIEILKTK